MLTSQSRPGAPVPSIRWPPRISRSSMAPPSPAPRPPELLTRPAARPLERGVRIAGGGRLRRSPLGEVLDLEAAGPEPPDPVAVRHVKLHTRIPRPLDPKHPEFRSQQPVGDRQIVLGRNAQREERRVHEEDQLTPG